MGLLNIIRRMALREKLSIREIARRTGLSRNTVAKHLNSGTIEPRFATPERPSKIDPFADKLAAWLGAEAARSRKQKRTLKQLHSDLVALGFTGSYGRVAAFARQWRADRQREQQTTGRGTFVPLTFRAGEAFQFDWSEDHAVLSGERWEKGQVEKNVQDARPRLWQPMPNAADLAALNAWLERRCQELWQEIPHGTLPGTIADVLAQEQAALMPLPAAFDGFVEQSKRVSPTCLISFERNRYSVPASFANRPVSLRVYPARIVVAAEGQILCEHERVIQRGHHLPPRTVYDWRHYLAVIQRKPGALRNGAPFAELPPAFRQLQDQMLRRPGGDRDMVDILALVLQHDEQAVLAAVELALAEGVATKTHVLNLLHRLIDGKTIDGPDIATPQALILRREPKADVERYDGLRVRNAGGRHAS